MLKKASELSILCGVKVCLIFTDINSDLHTFSNTSDIKFIASSSLFQEIKNSNRFNYDNSDVSNVQANRKC